MSDTRAAIFGEKYRVVAVESQSLTIRGVLSGDVLTIINPDPETPISPVRITNDAASAPFERVCASAAHTARKTPTTGKARTKVQPNTSSNAA